MAPFAESSIRRETIASEDILHDTGAFSNLSSDSQAMGRVDEVITRTWQTAHKAKVQRDRLAEEQADNDHIRARRCIAKYTINPAIAQGMSRHIAAADPTPKTTMASTKVYQRNVDVVAEVLFRAQGTCGACSTPAPFLRRADGTPYLEVQHTRPAQNGPDTVENAVALCPNCHRRAHHGPP